MKNILALRVCRPHPPLLKVSCVAAVEGVVKRVLVCHVAAATEEVVATEDTLPHGPQQGGLVTPGAGAARVLQACHVCMLRGPPRD